MTAPAAGAARHETPARGLRASRGDVTPTVVAGALALVLLVLASDPLALRPQDVRIGGPLWWGSETFLRVPPVLLLEPRGEVASFPETFRWLPFDGTETYEVTVGTDAAGSPPLFRQRGATAGLEVSLESGAPAPPVGDYVWEVRAIRGEEITARGLGRFRVVPPTP